MKLDIQWSFCREARHKQSEAETTRQVRRMSRCYNTDVSVVRPYVTHMLRLPVLLPGVCLWVSRVVVIVFVKY